MRAMAVKKPATKTPPKRPTAKAPPKKPATRKDLGKPVDQFFAKAKGDQKPILDKLRQLVERELPDATSSIKWGNAFYEVAGEMTVAISAHKAHANLIMTGSPKDFDDPDGRLEGESKLGRHLKVRSLEDLRDEKRVRAWVQTAASIARARAR